MSVAYLYKHIFNIYIYFRGMKVKAYALLFFILIFTAAQNYAQSPIKKDSLLYYYHTISNPTDYTEFQKATAFFEKRVNISLRNRDTLSAIQHLRLIANGQSEYGFLNDSEQTVVFALRLLENLPAGVQANLRLGLNNQLGIIYRRLNDYEEALLFYDKALSFSQSKKDSISIFNNKSNIYKDLNQYDLAEEILKETLKIASTENKKQYARVLSNLGYVQFKMGDENALSSIQTALAYRIEEKDLTGQYSSYADLTEYYIASQDYIKAKLYFEKSYAIAKKINSAEYLANSLGQYVLIDQDPLIITFKNQTDSIEKARQLKENKYAAMKYDVDKEKEQTQLALLQNAKEKQEKTVYLGLVILSIIIFSVIIYIILANRKKKQLETIFDTETRISKKLHDELANDTFQVMAQLQALPEIPEEIIDELDLIYSKTRNISRDHNPIYEHTDFYEQLKTMLAAYKSDDFNVIVKNDQKIEWETLNPLKKKTLYIVLKELMTNNRKHSRSNFALISFSQKGNKLNIAYKDNGVGGDLKKNNGLQNLEYRIKALKGKIDFDSEHGKGFKVDILI